MKEFVWVGFGWEVPYHDGCDLETYGIAGRCLALAPAKSRVELRNEAPYNVETFKISGYDITGIRRDHRLIGFGILVESRNRDEVTRQFMDINVFRLQIGIRQTPSLWFVNLPVQPEANDLPPAA